MESRARATSKGQLTVPEAVRDALQLREGDRGVFWVEAERAVIARTPSGAGDSLRGRRLHPTGMIETRARVAKIESELHARALADGTPAGRPQHPPPGLTLLLVPRRSR